VNTGARDDLEAGCGVAHTEPGVHVNGAFGAVGRFTGRGRHKWLNVPYDAGYVFCADRAREFPQPS
jgi:hypothetical protein